MSKFKKAVGKVPANSPNRTWRTIHFESVGPFNADEQGNKFVFCVSDPATDFVEFLPAKDISPDAVADFLIEVFSRFGICACILSGFAIAYRVAIVSELTAKWKRLLGETEQFWDDFWAGVIQSDDSTPSDIVQRILEAITACDGNTIEHELNALRINIRMRSLSFRAMFGREFMPLTLQPKSTIGEPQQTENPVQKRKAGRPRKIKQSEQPVPDESAEESVPVPVMEVDKAMPGSGYSLRTTLKPKGSTRAVRSFLSKAAEKRRQGNQLEIQPGVKLEPMEDEQFEHPKTLPLSPHNSSQEVEEIVVEPDSMPSEDTSESYDAGKGGQKRTKKAKKGKRKKIVMRKLAKELPFKCSKCISTYLSTEEELKFHLECHREDSRNFFCTMCPKEVKNWAHLQRHMLTHPELKEVLSINTPDKRTCPECEKVFTCREGMVRHLQVVHRGHVRFKCNQCEKSFKEQKTYQRHLDLHANIVYSCEHCKYKTKVRKNINAHRRVHDGRGYPCEICKKIFTKPSILKGHMTIHDQNRESFTCEVCGMQLLGKAALNQHIRNKHTEKEDIPCSLCSYVAKGQANITRHMGRAHDHPFKCDQCEYSTKSEIALQKHLDVFHNEEERPLVCPMCPYRAKTNKGLRDHTRTAHNPSLNHPCPYCLKVFKTVTMMRHHLPVHTGQHLYGCKSCSFTAKYRQTIHHHIRSKHPGELTSNVMKSTPAEEIRMPQRQEHDYSQSDKDEEMEAVNSLQDGIIIASTENELILDAALLASQPSGAFTLPNNITVQIIEQGDDIEIDENNITFQIIDPDLCVSEEVLS